MLQCNVFPGLPPDFLDAEVNLFLVPFMDSDAENENPPRAGSYPWGDNLLWVWENSGLPLVRWPFSGPCVSALKRFGESWSETKL